MSIARAYRLFQTSIRWDATPARPTRLQAIVGHSSSPFFLNGLDYLRTGLQGFTENIGFFRCVFSHVKGLGLAREIFMPRERDTLSGIGVACIGLAYRLLRAGARFLMDRGEGFRPSIYSEGHTLRA